MRNPYPINPFLRIVVKAWMAVFTKYYNISANASSEVRNFDKPYLLLSNHYGRYDPFIVSHFIKKRPNFMSSDAILRDRIIGTLFKGLGAMPKKKGVRDSRIIREMVKVARSGGALAFFPEGTRTWSGETQAIDPSLAKLIKLLQLPVIIARMKGAYLFDPRWAKPLRKTRVEIDYTLALQESELKNLSDDELMKVVQQHIYHNDITYQRQQKIHIESQRRAEYLDLVLFHCPACKSYQGFHAKGNGMFCTNCQLKVYIDKYGFLQGEADEKLTFDNIRDWLNWQNKNFVKYVNHLLEEGVDDLFMAEKMKIECAKGNGRMKFNGIGNVYFKADAILIETHNKQEKLLHTQVDSLSSQFNERIEFFYNDNAYRFTGTSIREPGIKWELAMNVVWARNGQAHKIAPYFRELILSVID